MENIRKERDNLQIAGLWSFLPDPHGDGETLGFWKPDFEARLWREVRVPSCFESGGTNLDGYQGIGWYRHAFRLPAPWRSRRVVLRFEAVNYRAKVWLNGELLGQHADGFLPFEFELGEHARWDRENVLAVAVDNAHHEGDVPGMHVGWRGFGGILREVGLSATDPLHIADLKVVATPEVDGGHMECRVQVRNGRSAPTNAILEVAIHDSNGKAVATFGQCAVAVMAGESATPVLKGVLADAVAWSPTTPVLYRAVARLREQNQVVDAVDARFGVRRIEATPAGLRLNGQPVFLTGFNRHEDSPRTGMATDLETTRRDLEEMKDAGANFVRLCHYPHHPAELDLCDELGLLVMAEIPLYFWNDIQDGHRNNAVRTATAARQLQRLIQRDANHPSIIFWSVSNETHEEHTDVAESNRDLVRRARELDPTRLCVHVSNRWANHPNFDEDDVICVNDYPSIDWASRGHTPGIDLTVFAESWRTRLATLHRLYPSKPILVTEFGYCSFTGTSGNSFGEDEHARVLEAEFAAFTAPHVCGAVIWCWADHPWPAGLFLGGLALSPFGVVSRDRRKLKPFWTARALFRAKQGLAPAPPPTGSGGTSVIMLRPHLNDILDAPFPAGYGIRPMTADDIGLWTDIQRDAEPFLKITDTLFHQEFGDDLEAIQWRCFIVTNPKGLGVGTISAWYDRDFRGHRYGRIHWVALRPSCQGLGLGKAALAHSLKQLARWHDQCYLATSTERVAAIRLYLNFGFLPDLSLPNAPAVWQELASRLKHPVLEQALHSRFTGTTTGDTS